jgi:hypothetical protein
VKIGINGNCWFQLKLLVLRARLALWFWLLHNPGHLEMARHLHSQVLVLTQRLSLTPHLGLKLQSHGTNEPIIEITAKQVAPVMNFTPRPMGMSSFTQRMKALEVSL